ncbi:MAG: bifunctional diguanylate cyclase/phosphodiesterase [Eubacteriales bacterium]|nr:bifunctional diguanylate cyclase/phosphodiesterase [Eubacteriales bacterium]
MELITEYLALVIIVILTMFFYEKKSIPASWFSLYRWCLALPALSILVDIICVVLMDVEEVPHWLNMLLNSSYFLLSVLTCSVMALFLFGKILEHVYDKHCMDRAKNVVMILTGIFLIILVTNFYTKWLFWFDQQGHYHRGILNHAGYYVMLAEGFFILLCYHKNRSSVGNMVSRALKMTVGVTFFLAVIQMMFPNIMLNGTLMAYADMIFFIHFQSQRVGFDTLTGLGNRKRFLDELSLRLNSGQQFQIVLVSLRNMDAVNKKYGSKCGDELLYSVGASLDNLDNEVNAFRFGNVTFAVFCPYWTEEQADKNVKQIRDRMEGLWQIGNFSAHVSFRWGNLIHRNEPWQPAEVTEFLEYMLWYMKTEKIKSIDFNEETEYRVRYRNELIHLVRNAVEEGRFTVWFQPVYDLGTCGFSSAEALVRLWDRKYGMISPGEFIPLAEDIGLVEDINWIVLDKVCRFWKENPELPLHSISVNMSMPQLLDENFPQKVEDLLDKYGISREKIRLEMTERVTLSDGAYVKEMMKKLADKGVFFYLDDFGIGYSNFTSALQLPYECIKLDKSLMDSLEANEQNFRIVRTVTDVFHDIGCQVIAEGIETEQQADMAAKMGMDKIQGFYFAKPMPGEKLVDFLKEPADRNMDQPVQPHMQ